ncbi:MAG: bifunctional glutamate N-acetyltransferase/amino-acid acetyltransferase ArgJ [Actinomycetota bacterium]
MTAPSPELPRGFRAHVANVGVKDTTDDLAIVDAERPVAAAAVFTRSRFSGPSVDLSRHHVASSSAQAVVIVSKNANVANGDVGRRDAEELCALTAAAVGCEPSDVLVASTGVIGRRYPIDRLRHGIGDATDFSADPTDVARAMMTTDTVAKVEHAAVAGSDAVVVGMAKGVGMIEPDMATHISLILTDAEVAPDELDTVFRRVVGRTFNCVSIDTDTSTSDTSMVLANGAAGPVDGAAFEQALDDVMRALTKAIARDGEGANSLIEVHVDRARDVDQARRVGKAIVNSPLVRTAVHGGDPNWGRVAMAIGKCSDDTDIDQHRVVIRFGTDEVYPRLLDDDALAALSDYMRGPEVLIHVSLDTGGSNATVWGCDLSDTYVRFNADYTT